MNEVKARMASFLRHRFSDIHTDNRPFGIISDVAPGINQETDIGPRRLESGAGDGNRKYRSGVNKYFESVRYEFGRALRAIFV
jgi:hypothetical protein